MMKHPLMRSALLLLLWLVGAGALAWLWFDTDGRIKNSQWTKPEAVAALVPNVSITEPTGSGLDAGTLKTIVERPLFAVDRKVPPPPPPPPPPDALKDAHIFGLIAGEQGFVILRAEGKIRTIKRQGTVGEWTLTDIQERAALFQRGEEKRTLVLEYAKLGVPVPPGLISPTQGVTPMAGGAPSGLPEGARSALDERRRLREAARLGQTP